jgi:hypothetical protein
MAMFVPASQLAFPTEKLRSQKQQQTKTGINGKFFNCLLKH